jgi:hypothetical protein
VGIHGVSDGVVEVHFGCRPLGLTEPHPFSA